MGQVCAGWKTHSYLKCKLHLLRFFTDLLYNMQQVIHNVRCTTCSRKSRANSKLVELAPYCDWARDRSVGCCCCCCSRVECELNSSLQSWRTSHTSLSLSADICTFSFATPQQQPSSNRTQYYVTVGCCRVESKLKESVVRLNANLTASLSAAMHSKSSQAAFNENRTITHILQQLK